MNEPDQPIDPQNPENLANPAVSNPPTDSRSEPRADIRSMLLPWEGVEALRTVLGILDDREVRVVHKTETFLSKYRSLKRTCSSKVFALPTS